MINMVKLPTKKSDLFLRVAKGHFATSHSHINYYIDVTTQKSRLSEAKAVARELVSAYQHSTIVDTVLCLDGTQVIGTCLANELTKAAIEAKCAPDCVEMEGAAVSQIAAKNGVPCVILRAMSDNADEDGHEVLVVKKFSIAEYVATATKIVAAMVEAL